jgi:Protein of unknown function (DUF3303)
MLFASIYTYRAGTTEATSKRLTTLFVNWQPPKGYTIRNHYSFADGSGGMSLVETESVAAMYEANLPWLPFIEFRVVPVVEIEKAVPLGLAAIAWRESVKAQ